MAYTTIDNPELYFQTVLYTGDGAANHAITLPGDEDMQPDIVWIKNRDATDDHCLFDVVRGATKLLSPNTTAMPTTDADTLDSFTSDGFQVDADVKVNTDTEKYVAWNWKAGTTSGITTDGNTTITPSSYSFDQTSGCSVLQYTANGTDDAKVAHGLGAAPSMMIIKRLTTEIEGWPVFHQKMDASSPEDYAMFTADTSGKEDNVLYWSDQLPDSVNFTLGTSDKVNEGASDNYICYCFAEKQGYSKFGSYTGNGDADGTFIYTGFKPMFFMLKSSSHAESWSMYDVKRQTYNPVSYYFPAANSNAAEATGATYAMDFLSNGIKLRGTGSGINGSGYTFIYMAFAEAPFVNSNGVPCNAR